MCSLWETWIDSLVDKTNMYKYNTQHMRENTNVYEINIMKLFTSTVVSHVWM